jgi:alpha-2-macroglobulin
VLVETWVDIPKDGEKRVDWTVKVKKEGALRVRMTAQCGKAADAMEMTLPVLVHGVERMTAQSGVLKQQRSAVANVELPAARKPGSSELVVQLNPSLATVMLDALPYLADYPYGCIEQTMSRFMPAVVVEKSLKDLGYNLADLRKRAATTARQMQNAKVKVQNANSPYTYPKGTPGAARLPVVGDDLARMDNPVFSERRMRGMVRAGLARIREWQHGDGGWGWWKDDPSDPYMTAYVLYGLLTARQAGTHVNDAMLEQGMEFLRGQFLKDTDLHQMAYEARVLAMDPQYHDAIRPLTTGKLYQRRERLGAYSKALLALALHQIGEKEKAGVLLRNIESIAKVDEANGTANWDDCDRYWWHWYNDKAETNATILQAYLSINPNSRLAPMVMKWLVNNRRGTAWQSTKETALAVLAMAEYARVNKELAADYTITVDLGGRVQRKYAVNHQNALFFDNQFVVPDGLLQTGSQPLSVTKSGNGTLYWSAYTRYFSLEEPIKATGNEVFVTRKYYRLLPGTAKGAPEATPLPEDRPNPFLSGRYELLDEGGESASAPSTEGGAQYDRVPLNEGEVVTSGDLLEVDLELESKNDYDYVIFEDLKPAGCEPVELRSGGKYSPGLCSNMELRDQKVAFFLSSLPQGRRTLSYRLRAEIPGRFHVLPTNGYAMYAPDVRTLSSEVSLAVKDEERD